MFYPVYIHKSDDGSASGFFPDVPGCYFAGETIESALEDAKSALAAHFEFTLDEGLEIHEAKPVEAHMDDEDCQGGIWAGVLMDMARFDRKAQRVQITLPGDLLARIDSFVKANGDEYASRSGFLADVARRELVRHAQ